MKMILWILVAIVALIGLFFAFNFYIYNEKQAPEDQVQLQVSL